MNLNDREILFEFVRQGAYVRVSAIDVQTKTEAVIITPSTLTEEQMKQQVLKKLEYLLNKNN